MGEGGVQRTTCSLSGFSSDVRLHSKGPHSLYNLTTHSLASASTELTLASADTHIGA